MHLKQNLITVIYAQRTSIKLPISTKSAEGREKTLITTVICRFGGGERAQSAVSRIQFVKIWWETNYICTLQDIHADSAGPKVAKAPSRGVIK